jgi:hypothetical protein
VQNPFDLFFLPFVPSLPDLPVAFNIKEALAVNSSYLDLLSRLSALVSNITELQTGYKSTPIEVLLDSSTSIPNVTGITVDDIYDELNKLEVSKAAMGITINGLTVDILDATRKLASSSDDIAEYNDLFTVELEKFNSLLSTVSGVAVSSLLSSTAATNKTATDITSVFETTYLSIEKMVETDNLTISYFKVKDALIKCEYRYNEILKRYTRLNYVYLQLQDRYKKLLDKCSGIYVGALNASYIRGGEYIRVTKESSNIVVSAWKPTPPPCKQPLPL